MLGVYRYIPKLFEDHIPKLQYKAGDLNESVIKMWQAVQQGWEPPKHCSEKQYNLLRKDGKSSAIKGYVGHQYSFGGQYFQGYNLKYDNTKNPNSANRRIATISQEIHDVKFTYGNYTQFSKLRGYVIYCDPPYISDSRYFDERGVRRSFDHDEFDIWCQKMSQNNIVFVSEYESRIPSVCVWTKGKADIVNNGRKASGVENLYLVS